MIYVMPEAGIWSQESNMNNVNEGIIIVVEELRLKIWRERIEIVKCLGLKMLQRELQKALRQNGELKARNREL
jgi:hypothetical protein